MYNKFGKHLDSYSFLEQTLTITHQLFELNPGRFRKFYASSLLNIGVTAFDLQQHVEAEQYLKKAISIYRQLCLFQPNVYEVDLNQALSNLGILYTSQDRLEEATLLFKEAQHLLEQQVKNQPGLYEVDLALLRINLAGPYASLDQSKKAQQLTEQALQTIQLEYQKNPAIYRETYAKVSLNMGLLLYQDQRYAPASKHLEVADEEFDTLVNDSAPFYNTLLANIKDLLSLTYLFLDEVSKAAQKNTAALKISPKDPLIQAHTGHIHLFMGNWEMARKCYLKTAPIIREESRQKVAHTLLEELQALKKESIRHPLLSKAIRLLEKQN